MNEAIIKRSTHHTTHPRDVRDTYHEADTIGYDNPHGSAARLSALSNMIEILHKVDKSISITNASGTPHTKREQESAPGR